MNESRPRANSGSSAYRSPMSRARPGTRPPRATRGRPRSPAGPSSAPGGMPTARTRTRRRSSCVPADAPGRCRAGRDRAAHASPRGRAERRGHPHDGCATAPTSTLTPVAPTATAIFFGASYHADYATILAAPEDLPAVADGGRRLPGRSRPIAGRGMSSTSAVCAAATRRPTPWPRRSARARSPRAGRSTSSARTSARSSTLPIGADIEDYLATLGKKERHEIRRKVRRAEAVGAGPTRRLAGPARRPRDVHRAPPEEMGRRRPVPATRLAAPRAGCSSGACSSSTGRTGRCACRSCRSAAGASRPGSTSSLGDGVPVLQRRGRPGRARPVAGRADDLPLVERALAAGVRRLDFLRGNEPYKYEWGAVDEPIQRLLVRRRNG